MSEESDLFNEQWYFGDISRDDAQKLLRGQPVGTFLLRKSAKEAGLVLSLQETVSCRHFLASPKVDGGYTFFNGQLSFRTAKELVEYFQLTPVLTNITLGNPAPKPLKIALWAFQSKTAEELSVKRGELLRFQYQKGKWSFCVSKDTDHQGLVPADYIVPFDPKTHIPMRPSTARNFYCHFVSVFALPCQAHVIANRKSNILDDSQFKVKSGEYVTVHNITSEGFCQIEKHNKPGRLGMVPMNCLNLQDLLYAAQKVG